MKTREEEIKEFLSILQPHVNAFSAQLLLQHQHEDEVIVGGKVISVFDPNRLDTQFDEPYQQPASVGEDMGVYITIDDSLGQIILLVFQSTYLEILKNLGEPLVGKMIIAGGQYAKLNKSMTFLTESGKLAKTNSHPNEETIPRVFCYQMELIETEV